MYAISLEMVNETVVVGAGFAGLAAALELHRAGVPVRIVEARDRIGGRAFTLHVAGLDQAIELGAEFIHGKPPELFSIAQSADLTPVELAGEIWCANNGAVTPCSLFDRAQAILEGLSDRVPDTSFLAYVRDHVEIADPDDMRSAIAYVRGFHAADPAQISVHSIVHGDQADEQIEGDRQFRPAEGYGQLVSWYSAELAGVPIDLNTVVRRIRWAPGRAQIVAESRGRQLTYDAARVVVTLPLGVLQAPPGADGAVLFEPDLPDKKEAVAALRMGRVLRVALQFRERFWTSSKSGAPNLEKMQFLFSRDNLFPTWWTAYPRTAPVLVGWAPDSSADPFTGRPREETVERALRALERILPMYAAEIREMFVAAHLHDWQNDPYSRGAYSYVASGGEWAQKALAEPVAGTLFFAGEACEYRGHHSTVHGAIASGIRAAQSLRIAKAA